MPALTILGLDDAPAESRRWRWTVDAYYRAYEAGVFGAAARVELLDGEVVRMCPIGNRHYVVSGILDEWLSKTSEPDHWASEAKPISLSPHSEPEPDFAVIRGRPRQMRRKPRPDEVVLVVELSDSSLRIDAGPKALLYAEAGISEYWVVDLEGRRVVVHRSPSDAGYREIRLVGVEGSVSPAFRPEMALAVSELIPVDIEP
jgi:Uma2 family endonuclease